NLSGRSIGTGQASRLDRREEIDTRYSVVRVVQHIEEFRPELDVEGFGNLRNPSIFQNREVQIVEKRSSDGTPSKIPQSSQRLNLIAGRVVPDVIRRLRFRD